MYFRGLLYQQNIVKILFQKNVSRERKSDLENNKKLREKIPINSNQLIPELIPITSNSSRN